MSDEKRPAVKLKRWKVVCRGGYANVVLHDEDHFWTRAGAQRQANVRDAIAYVLGYGQWWTVERR